MSDLSLKRRRKALSRNIQEHLAANASASSIYALTLCHEHFLNVVAAELANLASQSSSLSSSTIPTAMESLGFSKWYKRAAEIVDRRKPAKKKQKFTPDLEAEQERLLAASKEKALQSGKWFLTEHCGERHFY